MTGGCRKVPSKTFQFAAISEDDLADLFEHHLRLSSLLGASESILDQVPFLAAVVDRALHDADLAWVQVIRRSTTGGDHRN